MTLTLTDFKQENAFILYSVDSVGTIFMRMATR